MDKDPNPEIQDKPKPSVKVIYAGGTISSLSTPEGHREGGHVVDLVGKLKQHIPNYSVNITLGDAEVAYTGLSENIDDEYWEAIDQKVADSLESDPKAVVITHGTDSMEQTARRLQAEYGELLQTKNSVIILTGANDDISAPGTDAWDNLGFAFSSAGSDLEPGVYVAFHGKLIPADLVVKEPFNDIEMNYAAIDDPEYIAAVENQKQRAAQLIGELEATYGTEGASSVVVDYPVNVARADHQDLISYIDSTQVDSVLLTLYHSGTASVEKPASSVADLARQLQAKGVAVFAVTENGEAVNFGAYETSIKLADAGIVPLGNMLHDVALAKLRLMDPSFTHEELIQEMQTNKVGELSVDIN